MREAGRAAGARDGDAQGGVLHARWRAGLGIVNLRGDPADTAFRSAVESVLGLAVPTTAGATGTVGDLRVVWVGPDDWFVVDAAGRHATLVAQLAAALAGQHVAVTDVSAGYSVLRLWGPPVRDVLAHGCPLDLHPRSFGPGRCAGSHFFKASIWLWQVDAQPTFELLVRRSFMGYVGLMLERSTLDCGLETAASAGDVRD